MSNRFGQAYGLTMLSPIIADDQPGSATHDVVLRAELRAISAAAESPFANVPTTHLARWTILDEAPFESVPAKVDHFRSKYLMFTSNFDGGSDPDDVALATYVESLRTNIPSTLMLLYRHCVGFPGVNDARALLAYFRRCQFETTFLFGAYPDANVEQVLRALAMQRRVADFIADQQDARPSAEALHTAFLQLSAALAAAPTPRPGTYL